MLTYVLFIIGFIFLIKGADLLVDGASSLAKRLRVSDLVIGLTVVSLGTSTPEFFVNIFASFKGAAEIAIGNVLGSNIFNALLILGISSLIYPLSMNKGTAWKEIPFTLLAATLIGILANDHLINKERFSGLTRVDGLILLSFFIVFMYYSFSIARNTERIDGAPSKRYGLIVPVLLMSGGFIGLNVGAKWIVEGAVCLASRLGVSQTLIALTIVALGTSLPELTTSTIAAYKKNSEIAVGNVVGSNIFNILFVLGVSAVIKPLPFQTSSNKDICVLIFASFLVFLSLFVGKKRTLDRWEGAIFCALYTSYITFLIIQR
ncbi:TPA: sodium:proton exchanger [bacterium]|nr:sodium:proton exchanger [bacterium]